MSDKELTTEKTWEEFRDAGLLWWVNRALHLFGWSIVLSVTGTGKCLHAYPARCRWRGFDLQSEEEGFVKVTEYLEQHSAELGKEVREEGTAEHLSSASMEPKFKLFIGTQETLIKTRTEVVLFAALKAALIAHGNKKTWLKVSKAEFEMDRFAFHSALTHHFGNVRVCEDGNNGRDIVRLEYE